MILLSQKYPLKGHSTFREAFSQKNLNLPFKEYINKYKHQLGKTKKSVLNNYAQYLQKNHHVDQCQSAKKRLELTVKKCNALTGMNKLYSKLKDDKTRSMEIKVPGEDIEHALMGYDQEADTNKEQLEDGDILVREIETQKLLQRRETYDSGRVPVLKVKGNFERRFNRRMATIN